MRFILVLVLLAVVTEAKPPKRARPSSSATSSSSQLVVAYLPEYRLHVKSERLLGLATDAILFSAEPLPSGDLKFHFTENSISFVTDKRKILKKNGEAQSRLLLCIGGGGRSGGFDFILRSRDAQVRFVETLKKTLEKHGLDGYDIDREGPPLSAEMMIEFARLLTQIKKSIGKKKVLSVAIHPGQSLGPASDSGEPVVSAAVDRINLMTYDMVSAKEPRHSTFEESFAAVEALSLVSVPLSKILLGIPLYGRQLANPNNVMTYAELVDRYSPSTTENEVGGYFLNSVSLALEKARAARTKGLPGVMLWEVGQDKESATYSVLSALHNLANSNKLEL